MNVGICMHECCAKNEWGEGAAPAVCSGVGSGVGDVQEESWKGIMHQGKNWQQMDAAGDAMRGRHAWVTPNAGRRRAAEPQKQDTSACIEHQFVQCRCCAHAVPPLAAASAGSRPGRARRRERDQAARGRAHAAAAVPLSRPSIVLALSSPVAMAPS